MQYMLGKELSAAAKKRDDVARAKAAAAAEVAAERSTEHAAEKKLTAEEQQLERELAASRLRVESVEARLNRKALLLKQSRARRVRRRRLLMLGWLQRRRLLVASVSGRVRCAARHVQRADGPVRVRRRLVGRRVR